ncbi:hypothetical protein [Microvirga sesbaniae]|uniref:hypothetical protein n=1 Tax=Microvirga sesbaniae TaxID=681392 RepID=UPI0021CA3972|nr:hypothetical protein [Microvirga sp. HBU67692]
MNAIKPQFPIANTVEAEAGRLLALEWGVKYALLVLVSRKVWEEKSGPEGIQKHIGWVAHHVAVHINGLPAETRKYATDYAAGILGEVISEVELALGQAPKDGDEARRLSMLKKFMDDESGPGSDDKVN